MSAISVILDTQHVPQNIKLKNIKYNAKTEEMKGLQQSNTAELNNNVFKSFRRVFIL